MKTVFISSTFKDMQAERDALHETVFPKLRKKLEKYGTGIQELDLRWGVDTLNLSEEESGHQVLQVCVDSIDRCHPYIIVLLGERYGWIPEKEIIKSLDDARILSAYKDNTSITDFEIRYGALSEEETLEKCIFCFRSPDVIDEIEDDYKCNYTCESNYHKEQLEKLKKAIRAKKDALIIEYSAHWDCELHKITGLEYLCESLEKSLEKILTREGILSAPLNHFESTKNIMSVIRESYLANYVTKYKEEAEILKRISWYNRTKRRKTSEKDSTADKFKMVHLLGAPGSGKSALMSSIERYVRESGHHTILYYAGAPGCADIDQLKKYIVFRLEEILGFPHLNYDSVEDRLRKYLFLIKDMEIYCFIDGVDQIFSNDRSYHYFDLLNLCPYLYYVISSADDSYNGITGKKYRIAFERIYMKVLSAKQRRHMIIQTSKLRGKLPDKDIVSRIALKRNAGNPLYLSMILQRLFMFNKAEFEAAEKLAPGMNGIHLYMQKVLEESPNEQEKMIEYLFDITAERFMLSQYREALILLAVSEKGFSDYELAEIFAMDGRVFQQLPFQQMVCYLYDVFNLDTQGRWYYSHRLFKEFIRKHITVDEHEKVFRLLEDYGKKNADFLSREGYLYVIENGSEEIINILENAEEWPTKDHVQKCLTDSLFHEPEKYRFLTGYFVVTKSKSAVKMLLACATVITGTKYVPLIGDLLDSMLVNCELDCITKAEFLDRACLYFQNVKNDYGKTRIFIKAAFENAESLEEPFKSVYVLNAERLLLIQNATAADDANYVIEKSKMLEQLAGIQTMIENSLGSTYEPVTLRAMFRSYSGGLVAYVSNSGRLDSDYCPEMLLKCMELLDCYSEKTEDSELSYLKIILYRNLVLAYRSKRYRNSEMVKKYGEEGFEYCQDYLKNHLTVSALLDSTGFLYDYSVFYKKEWRYEYLNKIVEYHELIYNIESTEFWEEWLAYTKLLFSESAECAYLHRKGFGSVAFYQNSENSWEEASAYYERKLQDGCPIETFDVYISVMVQRAIYKIEDDSYEKAEKLIGRAKELIHLFRTDPNVSKKKHIFLRDIGIAEANFAYRKCEYLNAKRHIEAALENALICDSKKKAHSSLTFKAYYFYCLILFFSDSQKAGAVFNATVEYVEKLNYTKDDELKRMLTEIRCMRGMLALEANNLSAVNDEIDFLLAICDQKMLQYNEKVNGFITVLKAGAYALAGDTSEAVLQFKRGSNIWDRAVYNTLNDALSEYSGKTNMYCAQYRTEMYYYAYCTINLSIMTGKTDNALRVFTKERWGEYTSVLVPFKFIDVPVLSEEKSCLFDWKIVTSYAERFDHLLALLPHECREAIIYGHFYEDTYSIYDSLPEEPKSIKMFSDQLGEILSSRTESSVKAALTYIGKYVMSVDSEHPDESTASDLIASLKIIHQSVMSFDRKLDVLLNHLRIICYRYGITRENIRPDAIFPEAQRPYYDRELLIRDFWYPFTLLCASIWKNASLSSKQQTDTVLFITKDIVASGLKVRKNTIEVNDKDIEIRDYSLEDLSDSCLTVLYDAAVRFADSKKAGIVDWFINDHALEKYRRTKSLTCIKDRLAQFAAIYRNRKERNDSFFTVCLLMFMKKALLMNRVEFSVAFVAFFSTNVGICSDMSQKEINELFIQVCSLMTEGAGTINKSLVASDADRNHADDTRSNDVKPVSLSDIQNDSNIIQWIDARQSLIPVNPFKLKYIEYKNIEYTQTKKNEAWEYKIADKKVILGKYIGNESIVFVPDIIDGCSVVTIGDGAFDQSIITKAIIPEGILFIQDRAFNYCTRMTEVELPQSVKWIGNFAFNCCSQMKKLNIPNSETKTGICIIKNCKSITEYTVPHSQRIISEYEFAFCRALQRLTIHDSVEIISKSAFKECNSLTEIVYEGTKAQWNEIKKDPFENEALSTAKILFSKSDN